MQNIHPIYNIKVRPEKRRKKDVSAFSDADDQTGIGQRSEIEERVVGTVLAEIQVEESFQTLQTAQSPGEESVHAVSTGSAVVESKSDESLTNVFIVILLYSGGQRIGKWRIFRQTERTSAEEIRKSRSEIGEKRRSFVATEKGETGERFSTSGREIGETERRKEECRRFVRSFRRGLGEKTKFRSF